ncbi:putative protein N(5)-glutamine methyltransferase [Georgenia halophila]|uniref:Methyltransferase small domain-containing protein n=1 Tax=Georgenia halophila TaxID=620889 RepID=A0ABP8LFE2_9MICO
MTSAPAVPRTEPELVARLRAAGCVFAEDEAALLSAEASSAVELESMVGRRVAGEPLEVVVGWAELAGTRVTVARGVFVPRQRSALLVRLAVARAAPGAVVVDLGCGTGALSAAVTARVPGLQLWAVDVDPAAVACARLNLPAGRVLLGDLYAPLADGLRGRVDVLIANAPYVPTDEIAHMPPEARDHEHRVALDGGADGLDVQRRLIAGAEHWLRPGGVVLAEVSAGQAPPVAELMRGARLDPSIHTDESIGATAVLGRAAGPAAGRAG